MAAAVITKILRGFLKNLPKGEATKLAREHGFVTEVSKLSDPRKQIDPAATRKSGPPRQPATEHEYLIEYRPDPRVRQTPEQVVTEEIDIKAWEKAGFPGVREYATERLGTSAQTQRSFQSELEKAQALARTVHQKKWGVDPLQKEITDFIGPPTLVDEVIREANISELASIRPAQRKLLDFGRELTNKEIIRSAIREGVYNPIAWEKAGLSSWPEELRGVREMARIALDIAPARAFTKENQTKITEFAKTIPAIAARQTGESATVLARRANLDQLRETRRRGTYTPYGPVRTTNVEDYGTTTYQKDKRSLSDLTDEDIVSRGYSGITKDPSVETRDEFGHLLSEFKEWGLTHDQRKSFLRGEERAAIKEGKIERVLSEEEMDDLVRHSVDRDPLYGRPFGSRFRIHVPFKGAERGQFLKIPQDVPPTKQDVTRIMHGEETLNEIAQQKYTEVVDEDIAKSLGMATEDMPTLREELITQPTQERSLEKLFDQPISGIPPREPRPHQNTLARVLQAKRQQTQRDQFSAGRSASLRGRLLGQGRRNEAFAYGEPTEVIPPRVAQQLEMPLLKEPTPEVVADLRKRAAEIRRVGNKFRTEANEKIRGSEFQTLPELRTEYRPEPTGIARYQPVGAKAMSDLPSSYRLPDVSPQERRDIWREIRSRPEYMQYKQDQLALKREIYNKAPDLMEFETYTRAQRTKPTRRISTETVALKQIEPLDEIITRETELDRAFAAGEININNPKLYAKWKADAPRREAKRQAVTKAANQRKRLKSNKKLVASQKLIAKTVNRAADEVDAIGTGFIKKDGTANVTAWKKAGSPKPIDWEDRLTDKLVKPKQKLVDSFKKGSKIVTRKRGGLAKKPRGWGAARYKCN